MRKLTYEELIMYHELALTLNDENNNAKGLEGIHNNHLLESIIESPFATMYETELYPTDEEKIAITVFNIIKYHCFRDANKRTGMLIFKALLKECNITIMATSDDYEQLAINIATIYTKEDVINWINKYKTN